MAFKNAHFSKCVIVYLMASQKNNYKLVSTAKIELHLLQQYITPYIPLLKQDDSKTTLGPATPQAHPSYAQQFLSINVSNRAAQYQIS
jgi:hypothetical protein